MNKKLTISDIAAVIEGAAPLALQESYDNSGLIVGHPGDEVAAALLCVDITAEVMDEAQAKGCDLIISHHPLIFHPIKRLTGRTYVEKLVERAVKQGVALYACHTNLDAVHGGMSHKIAGLLGLKNVRLLGQPLPGDPTAGFGAIGELSAATPAKQFLSEVKEKMNLTAIRHSDITKERVRRVAVCSGAGGSSMEDAAEAGADLFITADLKYNDFINADGRLTVADIGHFESEYCAIDLLYDIISKKIPTFALRKSENSRNPINYLV